MSFTRRISLLAGVAVAAAVVLSSVLVYVTIASALHGQIDDSLRDRAAQFARGGGQGVGGVPFGRFGPGPGPGGRGPFGRGFDRPPLQRGGTDFYERIVTPYGSQGDEELPASPSVTRATFTKASVDGDEVRVLMVPVASGIVVAVGRSLEETNSLLGTIRLILVVVCGGGIALAVLLGRLVAGRAIGPLRRLTETAEHVAATRDLAFRLDAPGSDEIGRLSSAFDDMLAALDDSVRSQRQLIADASHELRTPVTSLRTNVEILQANPDLDPARRAVVLSRVQAQALELTGLMGDLIEIARGDVREEGLEPLRLDELVEDAIDRASRHSPSTAFTVSLSPTVIVGSPSRLNRAVNNLLDNAVKWNTAGRPVDVSLAEGTLVVRDRGPGFDPDELEHAFDRFFRGAHSREKSGSGLGLAIVRQVAEAHGGTVEAANASDGEGGAVLTLRLPVEPSSSLWGGG